MPDRPGRDRASRLRELGIVAAVVAVALLNGSAFFLKRTGVIDHTAYAQYLRVHRELGRHGRGMLPTEQDALLRPYKEHVFRADGAGVILKLLKDAVIVALLSLSAVFLFRGAPLPSMRSAWPGYALAASVAASFLITWFRFGPLLPMTGLRSFSFLLLAIALAACLPLRATLSPALATAAAALLVAETLAVGFEAVRGMPIYGYVCVSPDIPGRLVGTFDMPNTLGAVAVLACAYYLSSGPGARFVWPAVFLSLLLVLAGSSGTGLVVLVVIAAVAAVQHYGRRALVPATALLIVSIPLLPLFLARPQIFDSLPTRVFELQSVFEHLEGPELVVGQAFGAGSGAAFHLLQGAGPWASVELDRAADSLPAMLLMGNGAWGLIAFYVMVIWAGIKDPSFRPFWIAVFLTSLTIKVVEVFPVSLFIACGLARVFAPDDRLERPA